MSCSSGHQNFSLHLTMDAAAGRGEDPWKGDSNATQTKIETRPTLVEAW
jgi:hypothetical protein